MKINDEFTFKIPDLDLDVIFYPDEIKIYDIHSRELLKTKEILPEFTYDYVEIDKERPYSFILTKHFTSQKVLKVTFTPLEIKQKVATDASYILNLGTTKNLGYYVGLYEFGTFSISDNYLSIQKAVSHDSISFGLFNEENRKFIICRGKKGIECWDWTNDKPRIDWSNLEIEVSKGLIFQSSNKVLFGSKEGRIHIFNINGVEENDFQIEPEAIRHMIWTDACVCLTEKRFIYKISLDGTLIWKTELPKQSTNHALAFENQKIYVTTYMGDLHVIKNENGAIEMTISVQIENFSPITLFLNKWLLYTSPENLICKKINDRDEDRDLEFNTAFNDRMIRSLISINNGVLTGDDYGELTLLSRPKVEYEELKDIEKFSEFDP